MYGRTCQVSKNDATSSSFFNPPKLILLINFNQILEEPQVKNASKSVEAMQYQTSKLVHVDNISKEITCFQAPLNMKNIRT